VTRAEVTIFVFAVYNVVSALTGITSISGGSDRATAVTHHGIYGRLFVLAMAGVFASGYVVLRRRTTYSWRAGWVLLVASFIDFLYFAFAVPGFASAFTVGAATAVVVYWAFWWWRQRSFYV
jgi:hypothetical protein